MRLRAIFAAAIVAALFAARVRGDAPAGSTVLLARWMVDVERRVLIDDAAVLVSGERIVAAGPRAALSIPEGATRVDLGRTTLLPGLIDAHVHLTLGGAADANARATLAAGFTTVQDLGAIGYANLALRDDIAAGRVEGPRVVASGPWLGISGGICDFGGIGVRGADAFRARVREDVARGADLIKVCVSGWLAQAVARPEAYEISDEELRAAIDESHRLKRRVAVHALSAGGIRAAVAAGADLVVHGGFTDARTIKEMRSRRVSQLSTLASLAPGGPPEAFAALQAHMRASVGAGLPLAFGSDAGVIPHGSNGSELDALRGIGLSAVEVIRAATVTAAGAVGLSETVGTLAAGKWADVIAVDGNPVDDPSSLRRVVFVMKGGRRVRETAR